MDALTPRSAALFAALWLAGCLGTTPRERRENELGYDGEGGPEHNPGKPCLACHGAGYSPGGDVFAVAGTIYLFADDEDGLAGATVEITDARDRTFTVETNRAGNFMVQGNQGNVDEPNPEVVRRDVEDGRIRLNYWPDFPLRARVRVGDEEAAMTTLIQRDGSCSYCHFQEPSVDSVGRVFVRER